MLLCSVAFAYNPPTDTAGPLTVRLQLPAIGAYGAGGYADLSRPGVPFVVPVSLHNSADVPLSGTLRVKVIDTWHVEGSDRVPFHIRPRGRARHDFTIQFGPGTYNAHYPVHVYADFEHGGQKLTAHPILLLQPRIPDIARPKLPVEWKPVAVPPGGMLGLWRLPVRRERLNISTEGTPVGQSGREVWESASPVRYTADGIVMTLGPRPPSKTESVDTAAVEFPLALPSVKPLLLRFASLGPASFRVLANEKPLYQHGPSTKDRVDAEVDLNAFAGTSVVLRLEASAAAGEVRWLEPTILAGAPKPSPHFPPSGTSRILGRADECEIRMWPGNRGILDAPVGFLCGDRSLFVRGFRVRVAGDALEDARAASELLSVTEERENNRIRVRHSFRNWAGEFDVLAHLSVRQDAFRARFWLENTPPPNPWFAITLEAVSAGRWSGKARRVYGGPGNVIVDPKAFRLGYNGHNLSTSFVGFDFENGQAMVQDSDAIPEYLEVDPDASIYSLVTPHAQTISLFPARNVFTAVKRLREQDTRVASGGVKKLAGRFTFDLWSGRYGQSARDLARAAGYGITDALVVWHRWQRWGYDYRLPDIYPPDPEFGTLQEFRELVDTCRKNGTLFAPHDNYIDFYPDFDGFTYSSIVFRQNGTPYRAWFNYGREAQSYRARPDKLMPYVQRNVKLQQDGFAPTSYFIDVWASAAPYDYWTDDGRFVERSATQKVWGSVFAWIRDTLGANAPQISEAGHDKLIGWLDGADSQVLRVDARGPSFTWKIDCADSERIPWIDVAWHDKFILHGAGYEGRYQGGLPAEAHNSYSDDYMSTEVLTGHPGQVPHAFNRNVVRKHWLLNDAMRALAMDRVEAVEFAGDDIHRQHVRWATGAEVWVNRGESPWSVAGRTLPNYGFYVRAGAVEAAVELRDGQRIEWSRSPERKYEGGRLTLASGKVIELPDE
jgi:hypothetical protein